jgi:tripeptidyl-peptidase I
MGKPLQPQWLGFPDVAAQGSFSYIIDKGYGAEAVGTSASAPTFASTISLINNARLSAGKSPLGFLNPWLYSEGYEGLADIVDGGSQGCYKYYGTPPIPAIPYASWSATRGWDPVTGLGTPDFKKLLQMVVPGADWRGMGGR